MSITEYTTYADVRAALGVEDDELEDSTLDLEMYSLGLSEYLEEVSPNLVDTFMSIRDKEKDDRSKGEARVFNLTKLYATFSVAKLLSPALPMFGVKSTSDGKASMSRFSGEPYKEVLKRIAEQHDLYRGRLEAALEDLASTNSPMEPLMSFQAVGAAYDPVTGE